MQTIKKGAMRKETSFYSVRNGGAAWQFAAQKWAASVTPYPADLQKRVGQCTVVATS